MKVLRFIALLSAGICFLQACKPSNTTENLGNTDNPITNKESESLFVQLPPSKSGINFINKLVETDSANILTYGYFYNGSGVAVGDLNNDSLPDLFFTSNQGRGALYLNEGGMKFREVTSEAGIIAEGWCTGVSFADIDNDGWLDIYINRSNHHKSRDERENLLYRNNGDGSFTEEGEKRGLADPGYGSNSNFFDVDNDGDLDVFLANHPTEIGMDIRKSNAKKKSDEYSTDRFFINDGNGFFSDVSKKAGIESYAFSLSTLASDFNNDGYTDLYVCNDFYFPDFLYINQGDGTFKEELVKYFKHTSTNSKGSDIADINNDGKQDLMVLDMLPGNNYRRKTLLGPANFDYHIIRLDYGYGHQYMKNVLQTRTEHGNFQDVANYAGVEATDWSWTPLLADFDNDGYRDIYVTNGYLRNITDQDFIGYEDNFRKENQRNLNAKELAQVLPENRLRNYAFRNKGNLRFTDVSKKWGLDKSSISNSSICADLDRDGDMDIVTCNINDPIAIYRNQSSTGKGISLSFKGEESNINGIGCKVWLETTNGRQYAENYPNKGYQSCRESRVHFGLGEAKVEKVKVIWPSGKINELTDISDYHITIEEKLAEGVAEEEVQEDKLFDQSAKYGLTQAHVESGFVDYQREPMLPLMYSKMGPSTSVGDLNGDGTDDIIFGSSTGGDVKIYFQINGKFILQKNKLKPGLPSSVETGQILLFDSDQDQDLDIYICAGGNEHLNPRTGFYMDRLYLNDGEGNFSYANGNLPDIVNVPNSVVTSADIDSDGDLDLFVGPNYLPGQYPNAFFAIFLENIDGKFYDAAPKWGMNSVELGAVRAAQFVDFNNDGKKELIVASHWSELRVFEFSGNRFIETTKKLGLEGIKGLWNGLLTSDLDNDGDLDLVASNWGLNSQIDASKHTPIYLDLGDFSGTGTQDIIVSKHYDKIIAPIYSLREMYREYKTLVAQNYSSNYEFALSNRNDILARSGVEYETFMINDLNHYYFENRDGVFVRKKLPVAAQMAPVYGMDVLDANGDGLKDLIMVGNSYDTKVELGWEDAFNGLVLINKGNGSFEEMKNSGFFAPHNAQSLVRIRVMDKLVYIVGNNHEKPGVFSMNKEIKWDKSVSHLHNGYFSQHSNWQSN